MTSNYYFKELFPLDLTHIDLTQFTFVGINYGIRLI